MRYAVVIENAGSNYAGYAPDVPGCIATADTPENVRELLREAIQLHIEGLREDGLPIPEPQSQLAYVDA